MRLQICCLMRCYLMADGYCPMYVNSKREPEDIFCSECAKCLYGHPNTEK